MTCSYNTSLKSIFFNKGSDPASPSTPQYDIFDIELVDKTGGTEMREIQQRAVFFTSFPSRQPSGFGKETGVYMYSPGRLGVDQNMHTNIDGIYATGDANSDNSTNVPHALYSGKRAAIFLHQKLSEEDSLREMKQVFKFVKNITRVHRPDPRSIWSVMKWEEPGE